MPVLHDGLLDPVSWAIGCLSDESDQELLQQVAGVGSAGTR
jgi:hypothetical protein